MSSEPETKSRPEDVLSFLKMRIRPWMIVTAIGACLALLGMIVFLASHAMTTPFAGTAYNPDEQRFEELLCAVFGMVMFVVGGLVAMVGLAAWCRGDAR